MKRTILIFSLIAGLFFSGCGALSGLNLEKGVRLANLGGIDDRYYFTDFYAITPDLFFTIDNENNLLSFRLRDTAPLQGKNILSKVYSIVGVDSSGVFVSRMEIEDYSKQDVYYVAFSDDSATWIQEVYYGKAMYDASEETLYFLHNNDEEFNEPIPELRMLNLKSGKTSNVLCDKKRILLPYWSQFHYADGTFLSSNSNYRFVKGRAELFDEENLDNMAYNRKFGIMTLQYEANIYNRNGVLLTENFLMDYTVWKNKLYYMEWDYEKQITNFYDISLNGQNKSLLRKDTHLEKLAVSNDRLYGMACYSTENNPLYKIHELDEEGKPVSNVAEFNTDYVSYFEAYGNLLVTKLYINDGVFLYVYNNKNLVLCQQISPLSGGGDEC